MKSDYESIRIGAVEAGKIAQQHYGLKGGVTPLPGELDFNFRIDSASGSFILKISRPGVERSFADYQNQLLDHLLQDPELVSPRVISNINKQQVTDFSDNQGRPRMVRLLSWIDGRQWSTVNPITDQLLFSLGTCAGKVSRALAGFEHPLAYREFEWDISRSSWTFDQLHLFRGKEKETVGHFHQMFRDRLPLLVELRKGVIHNDANDHNIIVTEDLAAPKVKAIIDFGDAIHTQVINDLAVVTAYAVMGKPDVLSAACQVISGYHSSFSLTERELEMLYALVAMRLVISVTKSAINKKQEPDNAYLLVSEKQAWKVLNLWKEIHPDFAHYRFRKACGYAAHPGTGQFRAWLAGQRAGVDNLFPTIEKATCQTLDLGMQSALPDQGSGPDDLAAFEQMMLRWQAMHPGKIPAGGYMETRPLYTTADYIKEGNNGPEYRTVHLGVDFWLPEDTQIHALFTGTVYISKYHEGIKAYGGLVVLEHDEDGMKFYTLYGHLSRRSVEKLKPGDPVRKGEGFCRLGTHEENGHWGTHLHFQLILDMLGNREDYPGVAFPSEQKFWEDLCPDPNLLFKEPGMLPQTAPPAEKILQFRRQHLGRSLSLSYAQPLHIVRGAGAYLMDVTGRRYLDTINNVAHVGHQHPQIVRAGQQQMAVLNTNTRYLHAGITDFAGALLETLPKELSVVHVVNSGSEANELALRMARTITGQQDFLVLEVGYHGHTTACVEVSSYKFDGKGGKGAPEHTHVVPLPDPYRGLYRGENTGSRYAEHARTAVKQIHENGRGVAGFIAESIMSCGGQIVLPEGFLSSVYDLIRNAGGVCIADEVQVGCGRTGSHFWGFELHGVVPDIVTIGKPIGNGHPLAAVVCTREVADAFANGMEYFNTFGGNPVSCAIGLEVLKVIKKERLQENALKTGHYLKSGLLALQQEFPTIGEVRGHGLFLGIELADENRRPLTDKAAYLVNRMKTLGILMSTDGRDNNVLKIKPPMVFMKAHADELLERLKSVLAEDYMMF